MSGLNLRVAPIEIDLCSPPVRVLWLSRYPQGSALLTLPEQGVVRSGERVPEGRSPPPLRALECTDQLFPAGAPLQGTVSVTQNIQPEASLERLVPLVYFLVEWKNLPNVSQWVLHTIERGYAIQFRSRPPRFSGVLRTVVGPEQSLVMEQEVTTLLQKGAIERVPPPSRESGYYSRYFIVPKKDGGLRPILDLRLLNRTVGKLKFKMLTLKQIVSQIRSEDWFVTIDLKDAYFHVSILPQHILPQVPEVCFWGRSIPVSGSSVRPSTLTPNVYEM